MIDKVKNDFTRIFQYDPAAVYFAPGRVNLIGDHTDYNGGHVLPCALSCGTYAAVAKRADRLIRLYSENFPQTGIIEIDLDHIQFDPQDNWANYPKGVIAVGGKSVLPLTTGCDVLYSGDIPGGAGLSSSASIEVCTTVMLADMFDCQLDAVTVSQISQRAENEFVGMNCGIMDQLVAAAGQKDHALLLNCANLQYRLIPLPLRDAALVIANSNKKRELAGSKYNERRAECEQALAALNTRYKRAFICDFTLAELDENLSLLPGATVYHPAYKRARHAITENERVLQAATFLRQADLENLGRLMVASHNSLRDDYETSVREMDILVELFMAQDGVWGARMTGGGFGGCVVGLVKKNAVAAVIENVAPEYERQTGLRADFYIAQTGAGARKVF